MGKSKSKKALQPGSYRKGPDMDGFATIQEESPLVCSEANIAPFTLPIEAFTFTPDEDMIISKFKNGDKERKIYCNISLFDEEQQQMEQLKKDIKSEGFYLLPSVGIMAGRFLSRARGDAGKAVGLMQATQEWRLDYFKEGPVMDSQVADDLRLGIVYFCGRDRGLRPTIIIRANRVPAQWYKEKAVDRLIRLLIFCMEYMIRYMVVPGIIENNCLVVDLKGLGISQVPFSALSQVYAVMSHHYIGRVFRFYVCNMTSSLRTIAGMVTSLLTDRQKQKLVLLDNLKDLQKEYALHQLEEDLGGTRPVIREFFPFPMQAGPFDAGCTTGADPKAVPGAYKLLSEAGARGNIWDPAKTAEENRSLEFTPEAYDFFKKHILPVPPACQRQHDARMKIKEEKEKAEKVERELREKAEKEKADSNVSAAPAPQEEQAEAAPFGKLQAPAALQEEDDDAGQESEEDVIVQSDAVKPKGWFGCKACWCSK